MTKRRRLSVNEYAEVEALDHMEVLSPILIRRNMQAHHPVNYQSLNHHSLNHPMSHGLMNNTFNHGHHNYSINTSQQTQLTQQHSSPILFHPTAQAPPNLQGNQQATTQQSQSMQAGLLELVDQNSLNTRFNQRQQLINGHLAEHNCNSQHCLNGFNGQQQVNGAHQNGTNLVNQLNQLNGILPVANSTINCNNLNSINIPINNYQRTQQQQNSPSRHRYNNRNNRWSRFLNNNNNNNNNNYQANLHLNSNSSNNHPILHTNRPNTLVYSPTVQSPLSPLINNLTPNGNLFGVQAQASPNTNLFTNNWSS